MEGIKQVDKWHPIYNSWTTEGKHNNADGSKPFAFLPDLPVYTDGSCFCGTDPILASAGAAAVQVYPDGTPARAAWVTLPSWLPQTAASAEHTAVSLAVSIDPTRSLEVYTDCAGVVASAKNRQWATQHSRPFAALWRDMPLTAWPTVEKVKAHRSLEQAQAEGDLKHWHGNEAADSYAKGAAMHNLPAKVLQEAQERVMRQGKLMYCLSVAFQQLAQTQRSHQNVNLDTI